MQTETCDTSEPEIQERNSLLTESTLRKFVKKIVQKKTVDKTMQTDYENSLMIEKLVKLNLEPVDIRR